jgi:hypothetical protein
MRVTKSEKFLSAHQTFQKGQHLKEQLHFAKNKKGDKSTPSSPVFGGLINPRKFDSNNTNHEEQDEEIFKPELVVNIPKHNLKIDNISNHSQMSNMLNQIPFSNKGSSRQSVFVRTPSSK